MPENRNPTRRVLATAIVSLVSLAHARAATFDVRSFGALGDGTTVETAAIQSAIDKCTATPGGGTVLCGGGGRFVAGTLYLKSDVTLKVDAGAALLASPELADYATDTDKHMYRGEPYMDRCFLFARDAENVAIAGPGTIDGQGKFFPGRRDPVKHRPKLIRFIGCSKVSVRDITLANPASWTTEWRYCTDLTMKRIAIVSRVKSNGDGLDFDGCTKVRVRDCTFDTSDDSICLQTSSPDHPCRDVDISGCKFSSRWAGIRIGLLSRGDISDVKIADCEFTDHKDSGLKIQMGEGASLRDMVFTRLAMHNVPRPVFITFCQQNAWVDAPPGLPPMKSVANLAFSHIKVDYDGGNKGSGFVMTGMPGHPLENLTFSDIEATFPGGGTERDAANVLAEFTPENLKNHWPEYGLLRAHIPASGLYARHVKGIALRNVKFGTAAPDGRPPVVFVDVSGAESEAAPAAVSRPE